MRWRRKEGQTNNTAKQHSTPKCSSHVLSVSLGMKSLNRIQSIVFDTAYFTSENLLISAPTGAGKTNIAMLTVLREIKNNIEAGVIRRDQFKVQQKHKLTHTHTTSVTIFTVRLLPLNAEFNECLLLCYMYMHRLSMWRP